LRGWSVSSSGRTLREVRTNEAMRYTTHLLTRRSEGANGREEEQRWFEWSRRRTKVVRMAEKKNKGGSNGREEELRWFVPFTAQAIYSTAFIPQILRRSFFGVEKNLYID
jgi:hypothetical protein